MKNLSRSSLLAILLILVPVFALFANCGESSLNGSELDAARICLLSNAAHEKSSFDALLSELERQLGVDRTIMRVSPEGVYVPLKERFVTEEGFFVSKPGVDMESRGTDPSFYLLKECIYRYSIKG